MFWGSEGGENRKFGRDICKWCGIRRDGCHLGGLCWAHGPKGVFPGEEVPVGARGEVRRLYHDEETECKMK